MTTPRTRGVAANAPKKRNAKKSATQLKLEANDRRRRAALEKSRREQERLEKRLAAEAEQPAMGVVPGAQFGAYLGRPAEPEPEPARIIPMQRRKRRLPVPADAEGNGDWSMGQARRLLHAGYHIVYVMELTGWGLNAFDDLRVDADGYGLPQH